MFHYIIRAIQILAFEGLYTFIYKIKDHLRSGKQYERWITEREALENDFSKEKLAELEYKPLISVIVPVYNVKEQLLRECIESVINQSYDNWQLCIADDCSTLPEVKKVLKEYENTSGIDICYREKNGHISEATNSAIDMAKGEFIALLDNDDTLTPNALYEIAKALNDNRELDFIYSDEDKIDENGKNRHEAHFKSDWAPDTLMSYNYTCHLSVYRTSIVKEIGGLRKGFEGSQDYDLVLRFTERIPADHIKHISKVLYHWRVLKGSTSKDASEKPYILEAAQKAKEEALERRGLKGEAVLLKDVWQYRVNYLPDHDAMVSIVIPSKDNPDMIRKCLSSIREKTIYKNYEIVVVDNGSSEDNKAQYEKMSEEFDFSYLYEKMDFNFSKMCNKGASYGKGNYILFLNDDIEVLEGVWLERMLGQACLPHTGAVGAKLLYPEENKIQHTGILNISAGPSHALCGFADTTIYYFARNILDFDYIGVTAACLMINKDKFNEIGGFNETMVVAYNDVDLCFKLIEKGYYNVVRNDAVLIHYESFSRGYDAASEEKMKRLIKERDRLYDMHPLFASGENMDPFYNRNLAQNRVDFFYNFENAGMVDNSFATTKINEYKESDSIIFGIDNITTSGRINVRGWAYVKGKSFNNIRKAKLLIVYKDGSTVILNTKKAYRADIETLVKKKRMFMIGFECMSGYIPDKDKDYRLAVSIGNKFTYIS